MAQRSAEGVGMTNATARPPHRRERLRMWMQAEDATCAVLFGADHVAHLTGYARYFGGPAAVVGGAEGRRGLRGMEDEAPGPRSPGSAGGGVRLGGRRLGVDPEPGGGRVRAGGAACRGLADGA